MSLRPTGRLAKKFFKVTRIIEVTIKIVDHKINSIAIKSKIWCIYLDDSFGSDVFVCEALRLRIGWFSPCRYPCPKEEIILKYNTSVIIRYNRYLTYFIQTRRLLRDCRHYSVNVAIYLEM